MKAARLLLIASAIAIPIAARDFDVTLVEPAAHEELAAGSVAAVAWQAPAPANVEEWEAFLSLDGGRTYPLRITPHLDRSIHRFSWTVPDLPGATITLMLRFGDERDERAFVFRQRAQIRGATGILARLLRPPPVIASKSGEEGAVVWMEGQRDGSGLREVAITRSLLEIPVTATSNGDDEPAVAATVRAGHEIARDRTRTFVLENARGAMLPAPFVASCATEILLLSTRLNV